MHIKTWIKRISLITSKIDLNPELFLKIGFIFPRIGHETFGLYWILVRKHCPNGTYTSDPAVSRVRYNDNVIHVKYDLYLFISMCVCVCTRVVLNYKVKCSIIVFWSMLPCVYVKKTTKSFFMGRSNEIIDPYPFQFESLSLSNFSPSSRVCTFFSSLRWSFWNR